MKRRRFSPSTDPEPRNMRLTFTTDESEETVSDVADAMVVGGTLRYATLDGDHTAVPGGCIIRAVADRPFRVGVSTPLRDGIQTIRAANFAGLSDDVLYTATEGSVDRQVATVSRVRYVHL